VEENKGYKTVMDATDMPYIHKLADTYAQANNYLALFHPSLPNYIAMMGGTNGRIEDDCSPSAVCVVDSKNIVDEIEQSHRSWKGYMESMPAACSLQSSGLYAVKHNPFVYFKSLTDDQERCKKHDVPLEQLYKDIESNQLPSLSFIVPNLCNDMHDCPVSTGDKWLSGIVPKILESQEFKTKKSLLVITWDEAEQSDMENRIPTILAGPVVKKGYESSNAFTHYSLLRTIEQAWNLQPLTDSDKTALPLDEFFAN
jgi:phospholipase C